MKVETKENYPDEIKDLIKDYNLGIDQQDIMEVNMAVDGFLQLTFSKDPDLREYARIVLVQIADIQPKFLQKGIKILTHRYSGEDREKSEYASVTLGKLIETKAKEVFEDPEIIAKIEAEQKDRLSIQKLEEERKKEYLEKIKKKEISLIGLSGEFLRLGTYYNRLILDENHDEAYNAVQTLIDTISKTYESDKAEFLKGCTLLGRLCNPEQRELFCESVVDYLYKKQEFSKKSEKESLREIMINIFDDIQDILPPKIALEYRQEVEKRKEEIKRESVEKAEREKALRELSIDVPLLWEKEVKDIAEAYNKAAANEIEKDLKKIPDLLEEAIFHKDERIRNSASLLLAQFIIKNYQMIESLVLKLTNSFQKPQVSLALENSLELLRDMEVLSESAYNTLSEEKRLRDVEKEKLKEQKRKELDRIDKIKIEFSADWSKVLVDLSEKINDALLKEKQKDAEKLVLDDVKKYIYAEDKEIPKQTIQLLNNIAKKYPQMVAPIMTEMIDLFKSQHERRKIAVDFLTVISKNPNRQILLKGQDMDFLDKIKEESEIRKKEIEEEQLRDKWDAIKLEVTTIVINLEWDKKIQKIVRAYNEAIKEKDMENVIKNVKIIVDMFLAEKNEDKLNEVIEVIGLIAKRNIELIAPSIEMFLEMVKSDDKDKKYRAIKGLGEVCTHRPGWAYKGIDRLMSIAKTDPDENSRMKALLEISRIGKANPTMLVEHIGTLIQALSDSDKHVRRLAVFAIGSMAEAIPLEAQDAIPALRDALHDEYFLVRQFADKALKLIRQAMRK